MAGARRIVYSGAQLLDDPLLSESSQSQRIGIVADDVTGAADTGLGFFRAGFDTTVVWNDVDLPAAGGPDLVLALDTESREGDVAAAAAAVRRAVSALRRADVTILFKKVDSTLRGHVGDELRAALRAWHPGAVALVAPAFPAMRRTTRGGRQFVEGEPLETSIEGIVGDAGVITRLVDLDTVRSDALQLALTALGARGVGALICDAETDDDLQRLARSGAVLGDRVCWVGSAGLALALGAVRAARQPAPRRAWPAKVATSRPILTVIGTSQVRGREQVDALVDAGAVRMDVAASALRAREPATRAALIAAVVRRLRDGVDVAVTIARSEAMAGHDQDLAAALADWLTDAAPEAGALIAGGGATAIRILRGWSVRALRLMGEIEPGVPVSLATGDGVCWPVVTKAGGFGDSTTLVRARRMLREIVCGE
jgi:4-hydroxythreonine-4-phosphate dehydrogenase